MAELTFRLEAYQAISYALTLGLFGLLLLVTRKRAHYSKFLFIGLGVWALGHLAGMGIEVDGEPLYSQIIISLSSTLPILRFDQLVHVLGYGMSTLLVYELVGHKFKNIDKFSLGLVIAMAGLGIGALNEIFEYIVSLLAAANNIGQYENTSLDLVADLLGSLLMLVFIFKYRLKPKN